MEILNVETLSLSLLELGAGLGGGSRGRCHLQRDAEEGADPAGGQQGGEMARGEWARLMPGSCPAGLQQQADRSRLYCRRPTVKTARLLF